MHIVFILANVNIAAVFEFLHVHTTERILAKKTNVCSTGYYINSYL